MRTGSLYTFLTALILTPTTAWATQVQLPNLAFPYDTTRDRQDVIQIFSDSYEAYRKFAFGHDEVAPLSQTALDPRNGWGATIVDAMSTMYIMGLTDYFNEARDFVRNIDFSNPRTSGTVSVFESTIRYIGGLLSAYELSGEGDSFMVDKARQLADKLTFAWAPGGTVPYGFVDFGSNSPQQATSNIAEAGTLTLEWSRLSKHCGNDTYRRLAESAALRIANNPSPLPGLPAQGIDPSTGQPVGGYVTWGGGSDSYLEYLIKYARLSNTDDHTFADAWYTAVDSSVLYLMRESTVGQHQYLADYDDDKRIRHVGSHLACFYAGNWLLGGRLAGNETIVNWALQLNEACWNTYSSDATGIGLETFAFASSDGGYTGSVSGVPAAQLPFYLKHGYYVTGPSYIQRPEVLESNFYAWRTTGNPTYLDRARSAVESFKTYLNTSTGFAGIQDVNSKNPTKIDDTESFWFAEVLKYLYLTFDDPKHISLDDYVFNTEAHPLKAPQAKDTYGTGKLRPSTTSKFAYRPGALPEVSPKTTVGMVVQDVLKGLPIRKRETSMIRTRHKTRHH
ncbi:glycoside hydrolase family 47 protein [Gloeopeniophorella convolvens]|nr:glycoside hydrolase family 47 protein [Gloeopeniophorella convolvens]